jgi:hypothetical protein
VFRLITTLAATVTALTLAASAVAGGWNAEHLPSPAPGYLPKTTVDEAAWNASHLPSPAPGYLPQTVRTRIAFGRLPASRGFAYRDAAIGATFGALVLAVLVGGVLVAVRARRESDAIA